MRGPDEYPPIMVSENTRGVTKGSYSALDRASSYHSGSTLMTDIKWRNPQFTLLRSEFQFMLNGFITSRRPTQIFCRHRKFLCISIFKLIFSCYIKSSLKKLHGIVEKLHGKNLRIILIIVMEKLHGKNLRVICNHRGKTSRYHVKYHQNFYMASRGIAHHINKL